MSTYRLQEPTLEYESQAIAYINEFHEYNSAIHGSGSLDRYITNYPAWLEYLETMRNITPNETRVPSLTYFLVNNDTNYIVGMINIRLTLNETLRRFGGHIGYSIRPTCRRQGLNEINLYLALQICSNHNINRVYLDCTVDNIGSMRTILALGGVLDYQGIDPYDNELTNVYHIDVEESLNNHFYLIRNTNSRR